MKSLIILFSIVFAVYACNNADSKVSEQSIETDESVNAKPMFYGEKITEDGAINGKELKDKMGNLPSMDAKVKGEVVEVCKSEGCWMQMDMEDGTTMRVSMKEHKFTLPKDISGRMAIIRGTAQMDTTSVEDLRHFAEDAGKPKEQIEAIIEPEVKLSFTADGVIIK